MTENQYQILKQFARTYIDLFQNQGKELKPEDIDNCIKIIADALNGLAYVDDTQIVAVVAEKFYAEIPRVEVEITEVLNESLLDHNP